MVRGATEVKSLETKNYCAILNISKGDGEVPGDRTITIPAQLVGSDDCFELAAALIKLGRKLLREARVDAATLDYPVPLEPAAVRFLVVHCSASPPSVKCDASVIDRWHRARGFRKIGYHFVICRDGALQPGRALDEIGAHVEGFNACSLGICLVGGVDEQNRPENNFTAPQFASLIVQLRVLLRTYPKAEVLGHRDLPNVAKACPSFDARKWWQAVSQEQ
jgi:N-acetylmuramoyl-L-alanine amidase